MQKSALSSLGQALEFLHLFDAQLGLGVRSGKSGEKVGTLLHGVVRLHGVQLTEEGQHTVGVAQTAGEGICRKLGVAGGLHDHPNADLRPDEHDHVDGNERQEAGGVGEESDDPACVAAEPGDHGEQALDQPDDHLDDGYDGGDHKVAGGDQQKQIGIVGGQVSQLVTQNGFDLLVGEGEQGAGDADGLATHRKGVEFITVVDEQGDLPHFTHFNAVGVGGGADLLEKRGEACGSVLILVLFYGNAAVTAAQEPLADGRQADQCGNDIDQQADENGIELLTQHVVEAGADNEQVHGKIDQRENVLVVDQVFEQVDDVKLFHGFTPFRVDFCILLHCSTGKFKSQPFAAKSMLFIAPPCDMLIYRN